VKHLGKFLRHCEFGFHINLAWPRLNPKASHGPLNVFNVPTKQSVGLQILGMASGVD
jgi:hypothetical protein